jgi:hypothetical protein
LSFGLQGTNFPDAIIEVRSLRQLGVAVIKSSKVPTSDFSEQDGRYVRTHWLLLILAMAQLVPKRLPMAQI